MPLRRPLLAFLVLLPSAAAAQTVGGRAVGMAGAFVALADDLSALWYNPAGLVHIPERAFSASASAYQVKTGRTRDFMRFEGGGAASSADFEFRSLNVFPATLLYGLRFGDRGLRHGLAAGLVMPQSDRNFGTVVFSAGNGILQRTFKTTSWSQDYYAGPAYGFGTRNWSVGAAALLRLHDREYGYDLFVTASVPDRPLEVQSRVYSEQYRDLSFVPVLGAQWRPATWLRLGVSGVLPATRLYGALDATRVITDAGIRKAAGEPAADRHTQFHTQLETQTVLQTPLRLIVGVAVLPAGWLTTELTIEYSGALERRLDREEALPASSEIEHNLVQKDAGLDARLGAELRLSETWRLRAGAYTRRSHHPGFPDSRPLSVTAAGDRYYDLVGLNLGLGVLGDARRTSYGLNVLRGKGEALGFVTRPGAPGGAGTPAFETTAMAVDTGFWQVTVVVSGTVEGT